MAPDRITVPPSRLTPRARELLAGDAGESGLSTDPWDRIRHVYGKGYPDLIRLRRGEVSRPPDAIAYPSSEEEIVRVLRIAADEAIAVIPFGGGTSVTGGVEAEAGKQPVLCVDLRRLNRLVTVDRTALTATVEAGILGPDLEAALDRHGLNLGHFPQSFELSTLGGWIATRSAGFASTGYGKIDELVIALRVVTPAGIITTRAVPASASGPSLKELLIGSEGILGIITQALVRVHPTPERRDYRAWLFPTFAQGAAAVRQMLQEGPIPTVVRLSDSAETDASIAMRQRGQGIWRAAGERIGSAVLRTRGLESGTMCLVIMGIEGSAPVVARTRRDLGWLLRRHGAVALGSAPARSWRREYFQAPCLRDVLIDAGIMVDTLETAATWDRLLPLQQSVAQAITEALRAAGTPPLVLCHLSHAYPTGASLYYTVLARQRIGREIEQWQAFKQAATDAVLEAGGTLSHHHGIGTVHRPWMAREHGEVALAALRAVKAALDPAGIMNPGKLVPR